ncbi:MAG TPA: hypothetical protein VGF62_07050 [Rhizomicrobium sp.]
MDGQPVLRADAEFWRLSPAYDERGNQIEESYSGTAGTPIARKGLGFARENHGNRGNEIEEAYFHAKGARCSGRTLEWRALRHGMTTAAMKWKKRISGSMEHPFST